MLCNLEICTAQLNIHSVKPILVSSVYRPPDSKVELFDRLDKFISEIAEEGKEFIITGDMNCDIFKPKDNDTKHLKKVYADHHLTLVIADPTRVTSDTRTLIDHIATNKPEHISKSGVIACGISDHELMDVLNKHPPLAKIRVKGNNLPYVTTEVRRLIRQRDFLRQKGNKTGSNYLRQASQRLTHNLTITQNKTN